MNSSDQKASAIVGIVTKDRASLLRKAIQSAHQQTFPGLRVSVLNDGSHDKTKEIAGEFPSVQWTDWPESRGYREGRNYLMREPKADYYVSLDDDAWFMNGDEVQVALQLMETHPDVAAIAFDILSPDRPEPRPRTEPRETAPFIGCGHVLRLSVVRSLGGYVDSPGEYGGEEKDLALRLMDAGHKIMLLPGVHVWHDKTTVARVLPTQHCSGVCNDLTMTLRRTPLFVLPIALVGKLLRHYTFARRNNLERPFRDGVALFLRSIPELWKTRRPVRLATLRKYVQLSQQETFLE